MSGCLSTTPLSRAARILVFPWRWERCFDALNVPIYIITHGSYFASTKWRMVGPIAQAHAHIHFLSLSRVSTAKGSYRWEYRRSAFITRGTGSTRSSFHLAKLRGAGNRKRRRRISRLRHTGRCFEGLWNGRQIAVDSTWFPSATNLDGKEIPRTWKRGRTAIISAFEICMRAPLSWWRL